MSLCSCRLLTGEALDENLVSYSFSVYVVAFIHGLLTYGRLQFYFSFLCVCVSSFLFVLGLDGLVVVFVVANPKRDTGVLPSG